MISPLLASLALAGVFLPGAVADNCTVEPLALLVRNVTFPNGIGANRGIKLVLGDQIQGMRMSTILNNTRVRNILDCPSTNVSDLIGCQGASGSIYSTTDGSFDQVNDDSDWDVPVVDPQPNDGSTTVVHGYDVANFTDGPAVIPEYPLEVWANRESVNLSALALGPKSSTLQRLVENNLSPSSSFGLDYGSTSELYPRDGQIVFGGVNEARFDMKKRTEFDMWGAGASVNCPLQILLADVIVTNEDGDHSLLPDKDSKISACIDTIQNSFTLTDSMFEKFQEIGDHIDDDGSEYKASVFPGDRDSLLGTLTIHFSNGYSSVIPHYELISHERGTNDQGKYAVLNNSRIAASVSSGQSDLGANVPILGGVFLSQNYLQVDYKAGKFWLSPQVKNGTLPDNIRTLCSDDGSDDSSKSHDARGIRRLADRRQGRRSRCRSRMCRSRHHCIFPLPKTSQAASRVESRDGQRACYISQHRDAQHRVPNFTNAHVVLVGGRVVRDELACHGARVTLAQTGGCIFASCQIPHCSF
ncbi:hypothetical protein QQZ08_009139 [Neonectria magnoliae]|uniref:Peptidase A1 domain-containing protein n=1 Tax=Neonectria magnoliae TaxID=2732573 RepID=A0ABR1HR82_9HYPO